MILLTRARPARSKIAAQGRWVRLLSLAARRRTCNARSFETHEVGQHYSSSDSRRINSTARRKFIYVAKSRPPSNDYCGPGSTIAHWDTKMPKHMENVQKLRVRAEECRALAGIVGTESGRQSYLRLAESYDRLAEQEAALAVLFPSRNSFSKPDDITGAP
jgi:hypothetical protein